MPAQILRPRQGARAFLPFSPPPPFFRPLFRRFSHLRGGGDQGVRTQRNPM
ncbi:Hypothetical protein CAP_2128 [Chondromyces apiculatus DSM 436]|uniref:Uncharacterized protein n=1 Tax=Chondromyces apiculatus DSM 436 TaxID=1192034 RepID=A0A017TBQ0_9BACT|nr:Hypothetical protein CAP_2128 [Chondromyces apiculatus DSM 436]